MAKLEYNENTLALLTAIGKNVRALRKERSWTQEQLAEKASINDKEISHIEHGRRNITVDTLVKLATAFEVVPEQLFSHLN